MYTTVYRLIIWIHLGYHQYVSAAYSHPPLGPSPFMKVVTSSMMVDKTLMLKDIFEDTIRYRVITCPRGFGKSTNIDMIRRFAQVYLDKDHKMSDKRSGSLNFRTFTDSNLNLDISRDERVMNAHFGQYFTISLDFDIGEVKTYDEVIKLVAHKIRTVFETYKWFYKERLCENPGIAFHDAKILFDRIYNDEATESDLILSLQTLAFVVSEHFGRKRVILLIDNFDTPILRALRASAESRRVLGFLRQMVYAAITNKPTHVRRAVFYGESGMLATAMVNDGFEPIHEHLRYNRFLDEHSLNTYCGFTESEVAKLLNARFVSKEERVRLEKYYDGYRSERGTPHIYNPFPLVHYLEERARNNGTAYINKYWSQNATSLSIPKCLKHNYMRDLYTELILNRKIHHNWPQPIIDRPEREFEQLEIMLDENRDSMDFLPVLYLSHLYELGYLSYVDCYGNLQIPNTEVEVLLERYLNKYYIQVAQIPESKIKRIANSLQSIVENHTTTRYMLEELHDAIMDPIIVSYFYPNADAKYRHKGQQQNFNAFLYNAVNIHGCLQFAKVASKASVCMLINGKLNDTFERVTTVDLFITNRNRRNALFVQVGFEDNIKRMIEHVTELTPRQGRKQPHILKHLAVNFRSQKIEIATAPTREFSNGQWHNFPNS